MTTSADAVRGLWQTLSARDYDGIADWVTDDCIYLDVPLGPAFAARGPADIAKRLQVGWGDLAAYENHDGLLVADGDDVMYEHSETWTFKTGEVVAAPVRHRPPGPRGPRVPVEGLLGLQRDHDRRSCVVGRLPRDRRHELAVRRHRAGLTGPQD